MIDQDLIDKANSVLDKVSSGDASSESMSFALFRLLNDMTANYINLIEDNAEIHKEIARLNHLNAHLNKQVEQDEHRK